MDEKRIDMWIRPFAQEEVITKQIPKSQEKDYRAKGWVGPGEAIPDPQPPDIEVLELRHKDLIAEHAKAKHAEIVAQAKADDAARFLHNAKSALQQEPAIRQKLKERAEVEAIKENAFERLRKSDMPIPFRILAVMGHTPAQAAWLRNTFMDDSFTVGRDENGDHLLVFDKSHYLKTEAERKAREAAEKEAATRARMEVQGVQ